MGSKNLIDDDRNKIAQFLLKNSKNLKVTPEKMQEAPSKYGRTKRSIITIWAKAKQQVSQREPIWLHNQESNLRSKIVKLDGDKFLNLKLPEIRKSLGTLSTRLKISRSTCWRWLKQGLLKPHTNSTKRALTFEGMLDRLAFSLKHLHVDPSFHAVKFKIMQHIIHIGEKWFYLTKESLRYYILPGEEPVHRTCKSKRFITKVIFMCAVARPIYDENGEMLFDGKISMFPFIEKVPTKRKSKNIPKGTLETKPIEYVTREVTQNCLVTQARWPEGICSDILIQQDNCRAHIDDVDPELKNVASADGFNIHLVYQPANLQDTNVNDLRCFHALQSLKDEEIPMNMLMI